jgi:hypothetical protein
MSEIRRTHLTEADALRRRAAEVMLGDGTGYQSSLDVTNHAVTLLSEALMELLEHFKEQAG